MPEENPYLARYQRGQYDVRITSDAGKVCAQIYVENKRQDVLTAPTRKLVEEKVDRYLGGETSALKIVAVEKANDELQRQIKALEDALNKSGDSHAKCAQYERDISKHEEEVEALNREIAQLRTDIEQYRNDLAAYREGAKPKNTK